MKGIFQKAGSRARGAWRDLGSTGRWIVVSLALCLVTAAAGLAWGTWTHICADCPSIAQIYAFEPKEASKVFAADGSLLAEFAIERRTAVPLDALPAYVPEAFIAVEDKRFWSHHGVDFLRTARAFVDFLVHGYDVAGGSTITQQLAGNMFSGTVNRQVVSVRRKLKEMRVAFALERAFTKREILQAYLNQINFGDGHYGIQSAAAYYFDKDARQLNLPEAATLAALPKRPQGYSPIHHPGAALRRRNLVLDLMADQGLVTRQAAAEAKSYPLEVQSSTSTDEEAPYFVEWVRQILTERYGSELYEAGLKIYTTLDPRLQSVADSALHSQLDWIEERPGFHAPTFAATRSWPDDRLSGSQMPYLQGSFIALDPHDGNVLALIGGRDFDDSEFDRATQARRQPGSVFKPFVYTAAIASGIPASDVMYDTPLEYRLPDGTIWSPKNFGNTFHGPLTLREALYRSINVVAAKLGLRVGVETVAQYAHRMGISTPIPRVPAIAIGAASVIPMDVAEAYTTFANLGVRVTPRPILRVEDSRGRTLWESQPEKEEVLDPRTSYIMLSILQDVVKRGTGAQLGRELPPSVPAAGKTGTTNDATDAWFVGLTPDIVTTTWVGFDEPRHIHTNAQGAVDALPVNAAVLEWYYSQHQPPRPWQQPDGLVERKVDKESGLLATPWCPLDDVYTEIYLPGTAPTEPCNIHGPLGAGALPDSLRGDSTAAPISDKYEF